MKKSGKLLILIIMMCTFYCMSNHIVNAKEYPQISMGKVYSGKISDKNVCDTYIVKVEQTGTVYFDMNVSDALDVYISDKNGNKLEPTFHCGYGDEPFNISVNKGTYYIDVVRYAYGDIKYRFECSFSPAYETFGYSNNFKSDLKSVSSVPYETKINGQMSMDETYDYYKIYSPKKGTLQLDFTNNIDQLLVSVVDSNNNSIIEHYTYSGKKYSYDIEVGKGTYYLKLIRCFNDLGTYSFKLGHSKESLNVFKLFKISSKSFKIVVSKTGGTTGYQIKYKQDGKKWRIKTIKSTKLNNTIRKLKKKKTYRVKIRTYYTYKGKNIYSDWSRSKKISLK